MNADVNEFSGNIPSDWDSYQVEYLFNVNETRNSEIEFII